MAGRKRVKTPVLDRLQPEEAATVLRKLIDSNPDLGVDAERVAKSLLSEKADFEVLAGDLEWGLGIPGIDEINQRSGRTPLGYVDPGEAAWEVLAEIVKPFIDEMKRLIDLGLEAKALETCKGTLLGLYRYQQSGKGLADWAPDYPTQAACDVVKVWVTGEMEGTPPLGARGRRKPAEFPRKFLDNFVADWKGMLSRHLYP